MQKNNSSGLSLVEIVVSMLILGLIVAGGYGVFINGTKFIKGYGIKLQAMNVARQKAEEILSYGNNTLNYWSLSNGTISVSGDLSTFGGSGTYTVVPGSAGALSANDIYKVVTTTLTWTEPSP